MDEKDQLFLATLNTSSLVSSLAVSRMRKLEKDLEEQGLKLEAVEESRSDLEKTTNEWIGFVPKTPLPETKENNATNLARKAILLLGIINEYASGPEDLMRDAFNEHAADWESSLIWIEDELPREWERIATGGDISARDFHLLAARSNALISELKFLSKLDGRTFRNWCGHNFSYTVNKLEKSMGPVYQDAKNHKAPDDDLYIDEITAPLLRYKLRDMLQQQDVANRSIKALCGNILKNPIVEFENDIIAQSGKKISFMMFLQNYYLNLTEESIVARSNYKLELSLIFSWIEHVLIPALQSPEAINLNSKKLDLLKQRSRLLLSELQELEFSENANPKNLDLQALGDARLRLRSALLD